MGDIEFWDGERVRTLSEEAYVAEFGEDAFIQFTREAPVHPDEMTEGQKHLSGKMQAEAETNAALAEAGITDLDNLPHETDDVVVPLGDLGDIEPREYDDEGALRDLEAREADEQ